MINQRFSQFSSHRTKRVITAQRINAKVKFGRKITGNSNISGGTTSRRPGGIVNKSSAYQAQAHATSKGQVGGCGDSGRAFVDAQELNFDAGVGFVAKDSLASQSAAGSEQGIIHEGGFGQAMGAGTHGEVTWDLGKGSNRAVTTSGQKKNEAKPDRKMRPATVYRAWASP